MIKMTRAMLIEYSTNIPPLAVEFEFNAQNLTRTRSMTIGAATTEASRGGYSFRSPVDASRASQGSSIAPETFSFEILLDATNRMGDGEPIATTMGVQPEIDSLRAMLEPKVTGKSGARILASLGADTGLALPKENASVILFLWGVRVLPVFLTSVSIAELSYLPNLLPYVAKATVTVQVIESDNPFYNIESARQLVSAAVNTARVGTEIITKGF